MSMGSFATPAASSGSRRITSVRQLELLVEFMERHKDLALGRVQSKEARAMASRLWIECATICNAEGTYRNPKEWCRYWNDLKGRVKLKLRSINKSMVATGGGPSTDTMLSPMEDRVAAILGRDVVTPLRGVQQNPFSSPHTAPDGAAHPEPSKDMFSCTEESEIENQDITEQIPVLIPEPQSITIHHSTPAIPSTSSQSEPIANNPQSIFSYTETIPAPPESIAPQSEHRSLRSEHRPRVRAARRSLLTQQVEESMDESRATFARIEEAKIAAQTKKIGIELKKVEALKDIALAINKLADVLSGSPIEQEQPNSSESGTQLRGNFWCMGSSNGLPTCTVVASGSDVRMSPTYNSDLLKQYITKSAAAA